jgi:PEP-CTERM motif
MTIKRILTSAALTGALVMVAAAARADSFRVTLDTSLLSGPQTLAFGITNFNGASNTVALADFSFDSGSPIAGSEDCTFGGTFSGLGCSGDLASGITLEDFDPAAFFTQQFNPGASLTFVLTATNNSGGGIPDQFAMSLCDGGLTTCYSDDASGALLLLDFSGGSLSGSSFVTFGASLQELDAPVVTPVVDTTAVPEPATVLLLGSGVGTVIVRRRSARRRQS